MERGRTDKAFRDIAINETVADIEKFLDNEDDQ